MPTILGVLSFIAAVFGAGILLLGIGAAKGAPQEAAAASMALAVAIIPYIGFRIVQILMDSAATRAFQKTALAHLQALAHQATQEEATPLAKAPTSAEPTKAPPKLVKKGGMGVDGWRFGLFDDGSVVVKDAHGGSSNYPSLEAARKEITWWREEA